MERLKNRKKLTALVLVFLLVFLAGAAFAATPGVLQVAGGIGVGDPQLRVRWFEIDIYENTPLPHASTNIARIVDWMSIVGQPPRGDAIVNDRIEWAIGFNGEGTVTLNARAENYGTLPALVHAPGTITWDDPDSAFFEMFTITHTLTGTTGTATGGTWPVVLQPNQTKDVRVTVTWNGDLPVGGFSNPAADSPMDLGSANWHQDGWLTDLIVGNPNYDWANNFIFSLIYTVAP
jgi:hypothetical protein